MPMSDEHKAALSAGRKEGHVVATYLDALAAHKPKRGRQRKPEDIQKRLKAIDETIGTVSSLRALEMAQEKRDFEVALVAGSSTIGLENAEKEFVKVAKGFGSRKGISHGAWRDRGVPPEVLKKAGITR